MLVEQRNHGVRRGHPLRQHGPKGRQQRRIGIVGERRAGGLKYQLRPVPDLRIVKPPPGGALMQADIPSVLVCVR
jgi:hypothetical protein